MHQTWEQWSYTIYLHLCSALSLNVTLSNECFVFLGFCLHSLTNISQWYKNIAYWMFTDYEAVKAVLFSALHAFIQNESSPTFHRLLKHKVIIRVMYFVQPFVTGVSWIKVYLSLSKPECFPSLHLTGSCVNRSVNTRVHRGVQAPWLMLLFLCLWWWWTLGDVCCIFESFCRATPLVWRSCQCCNKSPQTQWEPYRLLLTVLLHLARTCTHCPTAAASLQIYS